jgi:putative phage-type endonuclease
MASVLGENPYSSWKQVFRKKTGQSRPFKGNAATRRGNELEPKALAAYARKTGKIPWYEDLGLMQHADYPLIAGSPDGITHDGFLIEIKCPLTRQIIPGYCPLHYIAQVQVLMEIFDLDSAHFVQYRPESMFRDEVCDITEIKRDREYFAKALPILLDFVAAVTKFYNDAELPIGTPMIDWDKEDKQAVAERQRLDEIGIGKVCAFIDDPITGKKKFIIENYQGQSKPIERTEHILTDPTEVTDRFVLEARKVVAAHEAQIDDTDDVIAKAEENLPDKYKKVMGKRKCFMDVHEIVNEEDRGFMGEGGEPDTYVELDVSRILKRMKHDRT